MDNINNNNQNNDNGKKYLSEEGFRKLKKELSELKDIKRKEIAAKLEYARSLGDLSENSEYNAAKAVQELNETRILEVEDILGRAVLITKTISLNVNLGSTVVAKRNDLNTEEQYTIVGSEEADPAQNKISNESPLGQAFLGKAKGHKISVTTPNRVVEYVIVDII